MLSESVCVCVSNVLSMNMREKRQKEIECVFP